MDCQWKVLLVDCVLALKFTHFSQSNLKTRTNHLTSDIYSILNSFGFKLSRKILFLMTLLKSQKVLKDIHTSDRFQSSSSDYAISQDKIGLQRSISYLHEEHITLIPWARGLLSPIRTSTSVRVGYSGLQSIFQTDCILLCVADSRENELKFGMNWKMLKSLETTSWKRWQVGWRLQQRKEMEWTDLKCPQKQIRGVKKRWAKTLCMGTSEKTEGIHFLPGRWCHAGRQLSGDCMVMAC